MCWSTNLSFVASPAAPERARAFAVGQLDAAHAACGADILDDVRLVTSELVTNAVDAGSDTVTVALELHARQLRIDVSDHATGWPTAQALTTDRSHGRGLTIVSALTAEWGVRRHDGAKHVWALIPLSADCTSEVVCTQG